jgi:hypothetical protein
MMEGEPDEVTAVTVMTPVTTWLNVAEVAAAKFESPEYTAVMEYVPEGVKEVERLAVPFESVTAEPIAAPFFSKVTVPVGVPPNGPVKVAVKVTDPVTTTGLRLDVRPTEGAAWFTTCDRVPVLAWKSVVAPYEAVTVLVPTGRVDTLREALPPESAADPSVVLPLVNVTVPVGVPPAEATVAVNVTGWS